MGKLRSLSTFEVLREIELLVGLGSNSWVCIGLIAVVFLFKQNCKRFVAIAFKLVLAKESHSLFLEDGSDSSLVGIL